MTQGVKLLIMASLLGLLLLFGCNRTEPAPAHSVQTASPVKPPPPPPQNDQPIRIGMGAMITPKEGYVYYQRLQAYIGKKLGRTVQLVDRGNYEEMNRLLETGGVDAAFVCAGPYVEGKKRFGMELLAMPLVNGKPVYRSYIIVRRSSAYRTFSDLRGKVFAFADPQSHTGRMVPLYMLAKMGEVPESFFSRQVFTHRHDQSIRAVADNLVDGAAVDSLIWEYTARKFPQVTQQLRIIAKSEAYGIPPVVVRPGLDPELKRSLREVFLSAATDPEGNDILGGMMIDRFVPGDDKNYDSIRRMNRWIVKRQKEMEHQKLIDNLSDGK